MKVKDIMKTNVVAVKNNMTIEETARIMIDNNITSAPVVNDENKIIGIISEKDLIYKEVDPTLPPSMEYLGGIIFLASMDNYEEELKKLTATRVDQMMSTNVVTIDKEDSIKELGRILVDENIRSVPVIEGGKIVGIVSSTDIVKTLIQ